MVFWIYPLFDWHPQFSLNEKGVKVVYIAQRTKFKDIKKKKSQNEAHVITDQDFKQIYNILGSSGQKNTQKQPKMTVFAGKKTFKKLKRENCRSNIAKL